MALLAVSLLASFAPEGAHQRMVLTVLRSLREQRVFLRIPQGGYVRLSLFVAFKALEDGGQQRQMRCAR